MKLRSLLFTVVAMSLLGSCSDRDLGGDSSLEKKVPVRLKVSSFKVESEPLATRSGDTEEEEEAPSLKATKEEIQQVVIYKADGSVHAEMLKKIDRSVWGYDGEEGEGEEGEYYSIEKIYLPAGEYYLAAIIYNVGISASETVTAFVPKNYFTDTWNGNSTTPSKDNRGVFYETKSFSVQASDTGVELDVKLSPMWSQFSIVIEDVDTFKLPEGVEDVVVTWTPAVYGFNIKDKIAAFERADKFVSVPLTLDRFKAKKGFSGLKITECEKNIITLIFRGAGKTELANKTIFEGKWEYGRQIKFTGQLGNLTGTPKPQDSGFAISVDEGLISETIPF